MDSPWHLFFSQFTKDEYLIKHFRKCNTDEKSIMFTKGGHLSFDQMVELLVLPKTVHIDENSMANISSFAEVANIAGFYIKMDTSTFTCKTGVFFISENVRTACFTQTLMTTVCPLILLIPLLIPTIFYPL